ncbi:cytochrome P450 3A8-like isoform X2 [Branchiostoma floridae]|uniref:Cytochrome P450 3A8-like isoform X2 n=1 Tax=Branchiostoma floridae TaxID=7739 RepID=A0A9J7LVI5_BRAFL|nr:cytochrome P450 3A8-like isoform X2 [Branchiostoma floridae]
MAVDLLPIPLAWVLLGLLVLLLYIYGVRPLSTFKKMGVPGPRPWPLIGNVLDVRHGVYNPDFTLERSQKYGKVYGLYRGAATPLLVISDREMLREVFVKQFHNFSTRTGETQFLMTKPLDCMLSTVTGEKWKNLRSTLSPAFSAGKLKKMSEQLNRCADQLVSNLGEQTSQGQSFEAKKLTGDFTMDAIASVGFGTDIDSQRNPNDPFVVHAKKAFEGPFKNPLFWLFLFFPWIMKPLLEGLGYNFFPRSTTDFFYKVLDQLMELRQTTVSERLDFMQLMLNAHKEPEEEEEDNSRDVKVQGQKQALTKDDVVSNGIVFFLAGYDTTATTMAFALYNLAINQEAQDKVIQELDEVMREKDQVDHEALQQMTYLEMCIMETLRLHPPAALIMTRICTKDTTIQWLKIPKGMTVLIPVLAIHYDPERWPEPKKFIPERFTAEEREKRDQYDWLPFGAGPRNCIGMRLAMMEAKIGLAKVFMKYRIKTGPDTDMALKLKKLEPFPQPVNGIKLRAELRAGGNN